MDRTKVGIIGLGLIGGSIAKECRRAGHYVYGADLNAKHRAQAIDFDIVDEILSIGEVITQSDVIGICIPVDLIASTLPTILDQIKWNQVVFDVGSTKGNITEAVKDHEKRGRFVSAHPLAGTEFSGPTAALFDLFRGKKNIICEEDQTDEDALAKAIEIFDEMGMQSMFMQASDHDKHMAYVSHLSHISAFTLSLTVLDIEEDEKQIFNLASTGFESTVRLAKSNPSTWASIFEKNSEYLSTALGSYIGHLSEFKRILDEGDKAKSLEMMQRANEIKRVLNGLKLNVVKLS